MLHRLEVYMEIWHRFYGDLSPAERAGAAADWERVRARVNAYHDQLIADGLLPNPAREAPTEQEQG